MIRERVAAATEGAPRRPQLLIYLTGNLPSEAPPRRPSDPPSGGGLTRKSTPYNKTNEIELSGEDKENSLLPSLLPRFPHLPDRIRHKP